MAKQEKKGMTRQQMASKGFATGIVGALYELRDRVRNSYYEARKLPNPHVPADSDALKAMVQSGPDSVPNLVPPRVEPQRNSVGPVRTRGVDRTAETLADAAQAIAQAGEAVAQARAEHAANPSVVNLSPLGQSTSANDMATGDLTDVPVVPLPTQKALEAAIRTAPDAATRDNLREQLKALLNAPKDAEKSAAAPTTQGAATTRTTNTIEAAGRILSPNDDAANINSASVTVPAAATTAAPPPPIKQGPIHAAVNPDMMGAVTDPAYQNLNDSLAQAEAELDIEAAPVADPRPTIAQMQAAEAEVQRFNDLMSTDHTAVDMEAYTAALTRYTDMQAVVEDGGYAPEAAAPVAPAADDTVDATIETAAPVVPAADLLAAEAPTVADTEPDILNVVPRDDRANHSLLDPQVFNHPLADEAGTQPSAADINLTLVGDTASTLTPLPDGAIGVDDSTSELATLPPGAQRIDGVGAIDIALPLDTPETDILDGAQAVADAEATAAALQAAQPEPIPQREYATINFSHLTPEARAALRGVAPGARAEIANPDHNPVGDGAIDRHDYNVVHGFGEERVGPAADEVTIFPVAGQIDNTGAEAVAPVEHTYTHVAGGTELKSAQSGNNASLANLNADMDARLHAERIERLKAYYGENARHLSDEALIELDNKSNDANPQLAEVAPAPAVPAATPAATSKWRQHFAAAAAFIPGVALFGPSLAKLVGGLIPQRQPAEPWFAGANTTAQPDNAQTAQPTVVQATPAVDPDAFIEDENDTPASQAVTNDVASVQGAAAAGLVNVPAAPLAGSETAAASGTSVSDQIDPDTAAKLAAEGPADRVTDEELRLSDMTITAADKEREAEIYASFGRTLPPDFGRPPAPSNTEAASETARSLAAMNAAAEDEEDAKEWDQEDQIDAAEKAAKAKKLHNRVGRGLVAAFNFVAKPIGATFIRAADTAAEVGENIGTLFKGNEEQRLAAAKSLSQMGAHIGTGAVVNWGTRAAVGTAIGSAVSAIGITALPAAVLMAGTAIATGVVAGVATGTVFAVTELFMDQKRAEQIGWKNLVKEKFGKHWTRGALGGVFGAALGTTISELIDFVRENSSHTARMEAASRPPAVAPIQAPAASAAVPPAADPAASVPAPATEPAATATPTLPATEPATAPATRVDNAAPAAVDQNAARIAAEKAHAAYIAEQNAISDKLRAAELAKPIEVKVSQHFPNSYAGPTPPSYELDVPANDTTGTQGGGDTTSKSGGGDTGAAKPAVSDNQLATNTQPLRPITAGDLCKDFKVIDVRGGVPIGSCTFPAGVDTTGLKQVTLSGGLRPAI